MQTIINKRKEAKRTICNYVDFLMSTNNPRNPDDGNWVKPTIHPCKRDFKEIPKERIGQRLCRSSKLSTKTHTLFYSILFASQTQNEDCSCRFNYPKDICDKTHLEFEKIHSRDMSIEEVTHQLLPMKLLSSSFQVITALLDGCRKISLTQDN